MWKKIPYSDEIKEILGNDVSDKKIQKIWENMIELYKKALPRKNFKLHLLERLKNVHNLKQSWPDMVSQKVSFYRYLGIALSFVCVVGGIMAFQNAQNMDFGASYKDEWESTQMLAFPESNQEKRVQDKKLDEMAIQAKAPEAKSMKQANTSRKDETFSERSYMADESVFESDLTESTQESFPDRQEEVFEGAMMQSMMMSSQQPVWWENADQSQEFREICESHSWSVLSGGLKCELPNKQICTLENIFPESDIPCQALYQDDKNTQEK